MTDIVAGRAYTWEFFVDDGTGVGVTGLLNAAFTKKLFKDDTFQTGGGAITVNVSEKDATNAAGWYKATYTPDVASKRWLCLITHATYGNPGGWYNLARSFTNDLDLIPAAVLLKPFLDVESSVTGDALHSLAMVIARLNNKSSLAGSTLTVYKLDESSPLQTATITFDATQAPVKGFDPS